MTNYYVLVYPSMIYEYDNLKSALRTYRAKLIHGHNPMLAKQMEVSLAAHNVSVTLGEQENELDGQEDESQYE